MTSTPSDPPPSPEAPNPPLGRRARKALAVRERLFAAGLAAFGRQPIGLVSILDITEAADVAKGVFYLHFKGKDDYLLTLWEWTHRTLLDEIRVATMEARSRAARIDIAARLLLDLPTHRPDATRFHMRMGGFVGDDIGEPGRFLMLQRQATTELAALIEAASADAVSEQAISATARLEGVCWGLVTMAVNQGVDVDTEQGIRLARSAIRI